MKTLIPLFVFILSPTVSVLAQSSFISTAGSLTGSSDNTPAIQTLDSNYAFAVTDFQSGNPQTMLVKMNAAGDTLFTKSFTPALHLLYTNCLIQTRDSGFIFGGRDGFAILKADKNGEGLWFYNYARYPFPNSAELLYDVIETLDGGLLLVGGSQDWAPGANNYDIYIVKTDADGAIQWTKTYGVAVWDDVIYCVRQTADSGYIMGGIGNSGSILMRTDSKGDTLWTHGYTAVGNIMTVCQTADGGFIACGEGGSKGGCIFKTDSAGIVQWAKLASVYSPALVQLANGDVVVAGSMSTNGNDADISLYKFNDNGNMLWSKVIGDTSINGFYIKGNLNMTNYGGFIMASVYGRNKTFRNEDMIIKTDSSGNSCLDKGLSLSVTDTLIQISNYPKNMTSNNGVRYTQSYSSGTPFATSVYCSVITGINASESPMNMAIYPNPFSSETTIAFQEEQTNTLIEIENILGEKIRTLNFTGKQLSLKRGEMSKGIYFVRIRGDKKNVVIKKIVIQ